MKPHSVIRWCRRSYVSIGWWLGDYLLLHPEATDVDCARAIGCTPQAIGYWRRQAGIPEIRVRDLAHPYRSAPRRPGPGRIARDNRAPAPGR